MQTKNTCFIIVFVMVFLFACKKDNGNISITGKWNVLTDSTFVGVGLGNHLVTYVGKPGDYFNFGSNGTIYTKESATLDTLSYKLVSNTQIVIAPFGVILNGNSGTSQIIEFTHNHLIIKTPEIFTPGGIFGRTVSLSR